MAVEVGEGGDMIDGALLCGFYGRNNLGDEAILAGMVDLLAQTRPGQRPLVLSDDPTGTRRDHDVDAISSKGLSAGGPRSTARLLRALSSRRDFILGGGDLLRDSPTQDVVGGWLRQLRLAQRARRRTAVVGISVGEIWRPASLEAIPRVLNGTSFVLVRDEISLGRLRGLGVTSPTHVVPDLALRVFSNRHRSSGPRARARVVVSVRSLADRNDVGAENDHQSALRELASVLDALVEDGVDVELVPMRSLEGRLQPVDDDYVASLELAHLARHGHEFTVHRHLSSLDALRAVLSRADLIIGMRLHSVIMAVGLGVPVVAISYDAKVQQFCEEVGIDDCYASGEVAAEVLLSAARGALSAGPVPETAAFQSYCQRADVMRDLISTW